MYLYMCLYITYILFIFKGVLFIYLFGRAAWRPLQWKHGVLTTGPPGKSPMTYILKFISIYLSVYLSV